jgi:hydrogenase-4 component B
LALLCVLFGVFPWLGIKLTGTDIGFEIDMPLLTVVLLVFSGVLFIALSPRGRKDDVWTNGEMVEDFDILPEHMYYPLNHIPEGLSKVGSLSERILSRIGGAVPSVEVDYIDEALFLPPVRLLQGTMNLLREWPVIIVVLLLIVSALIWGWLG